MDFIKGIFVASPGQGFGYYTLMLVFIAILIISSIAFSQIYKKKKKEDIAFKKLFKNTSNRLAIFATILIVLLASRYETIPYFSMRLWLYLTLAIFIYWLYKAIRKYKVQYPIAKVNYKKKTVVKNDKTYTTTKKKK